MADYKSAYTGAEIDAGIQAARNALPKSGGTMTGALTLSGSPVSDNQAATKKYVDDAVKNVPGGSSGGTPNAVQYVPQELTPEQQAQARANIGVPSLQEIVDEVLNALPAAEGVSY